MRGQWLTDYLPLGGLDEVELVLAEREVLQGQQAEDTIAQRSEPVHEHEV